jgi:hypothetical protein
MKHIWACQCGEETECSPENLRPGAVWKCERCKQVWGCVRPRQGGTAWVHIDDRDAEFHDLLGLKYDAEVD